MEILSRGLKDTEDVAQNFLKNLTPRTDVATVVGLYGDLGSGKTTFVQAVAKALGVVEVVNSPTFLILKSYKLKANSYNLLHHIDAYRLESVEELRKLQFEELLRDPRNLIFIEWADRVATILPQEHIKLFFEFFDEHTRGITFSDSVSGTS
ncbi:MAG: tRNA (adenosine(37)-N6)-threonylcarbamoyltransferase complex ATPase subunit type 1 TsaE [bacterium]|nr:tRNA (adenosine(37)-N6)-threonylcarbamoyltransferase complex ATPase subunit type 1 TsaE [bacterium]